MAEAKQNAVPTPLGTPGTLSLVTVTAGVPTAGSGTVSTLDNIFDATNGPIAVKAASTAPVATDKSMVVALSPNSAGIITTGTAGSPAAAVLTVQGIASMTAIKTDGSATTQPITQVASATANGQTSSRVNAAASTNATSLKTSAGNIGEIDVFNSAAYTVFLKLYNKASAPTVGTDVPVWTIPVAAGGGFSKSFLRGKSFATGIAYAITKLQADSDTTVVVAGDLTGSVDWI
jgi:hypothetical protein